MSASACGEICRSTEQWYRTDYGLLRTMISSARLRQHVIRFGSSLQLHEPVACFHFWNPSLPSGSKTSSTRCDYAARKRRGQGPNDDSSFVGVQQLNHGTNHPQKVSRKRRENAGLQASGFRSLPAASTSQCRFCLSVLGRRTLGLQIANLSDTTLRILQDVARCQVNCQLVIALQGGDGMCS